MNNQNQLFFNDLKCPISNDDIVVVDCIFDDKNDCLLNENDLQIT